MTGTANQVVSLPTFEKLTWDWQGHSIQYTVLGTGEPLVLIHGFGASIGHWRKNIPVLAQAGYQVYAIDLLGFGGSAKPALDYTVELWVELIRDFWAANIQRPTVFIGNSIGGLLCLMILANHPEIAAGGVLLNPAGGLNHRPEELNLPLRLVMGTFAKLVGSKQFGRWMFDQVRQKGRIRNSLRQVYRDPEAITDELVDLLHEPSCHPGAQQVFASVLMAPPGPKPTELLPNIQSPLLVIWGEADPWTPIAGSQIYQSLVHSQPVQFVSIPNAGHCPHDERPEVVNEFIIQWLTEQK
ncbi:MULTISPECIES: alpha/beta fold hydrolase [Leptolyngbya]|jgi:pimeloyl-ACP methyl ester carboxylesterase|uniref:Alpha/beta hydrolase fold-containing protein n=2 Tax=Leptolyngbya boryana TaxID=1184 RepID=A0A1Z4JBG2_LEPBY|nr:MULTISPECIES: alpha/beta fold hydrolase [Leptolyngbya]BAY54040.1 alpha/beta hydrolase fold-containing protein [Leptolyngbya boryana NIES-2135]MBD1856012.1 alpha/beta fold hydrolase [Leptolyngbya sp. FACHB-1624]MBD2369697.1 alpha/beta fold hydrolase [Leptolyngbya sp. FACHB-161]MBD2376102.1 alpha/beta fold hydrolase [Leptolyngbya sp. FACHB-238]MBD2400378.1 alpha/beta fold hydrolase [Leptolyngbya sp. FACHB-239]